eukprot:TRINITY_DN968_c0_g1_i1.p1 TRINITY_DN968_c0_g1~~TRINITY_DN968_c0_g1_i1.p1  ORF type:complete len:142 (+),score=47.10 TRINITY_DN968_c0_g1_i1:61-486(+)
MVQFPEKYGLVAAGVQGGLALALGIKMTTLRVKNMLARNKDEQEDEKAARTKVFDRWHMVQLNSAEYHPLFMALYIALHFASQGKLKRSSEVGITMGLAGTIAFIIGKGFIEKVPNPMGAMGVLFRYLSLGILSYDVATAY